MKKFTYIFLSAMTLSACSTVIPTAYREYDWTNTGYQSTKLADEYYHLKFFATTTTPSDFVEKNWKRRATELCQSTNFEAIEFKHGLGIVEGCGSDSLPVCRRLVASGKVKCR